MQFVLTRSLDNAATGELTAIAEGQVERIQEAGHAVPSADSDVPSAAGVQVGVFLPGGTALGEPIEIPGWLRHYPDGLTDLTVEGEHVRVVVMPAEVNGTVAAWVAAGRSLAAEDRLLHRMRLLLLAGGSLAVLASLVAGWWLAGRAVRPVERAYEAQAGFAADASHELRTPLTFVRSGVEVLAEKEPGLGGQVLAEVDYLTGLTQRLLLLARAERGSIRLEVGPVDMGATCRSAAHRSERAHGNALSTGGNDLAALADRMALEAALDAVLENVSGTAAGRRGALEPRGRTGGDRDRGPWAGAPRGSPRPGVRTLLPRRSLPRAGNGRGGARSRARQDAGGSAKGEDVARAHAGGRPHGADRIAGRVADPRCRVGSPRAYSLRGHPRIPEALPPVRRARARTPELGRGSVEIEHVPEGTVVLQQGGTPASHLYVVRKGAVELLDDGRLLDLLGEGEVFGQFSLLAHEGPTVTVRAHEDTLCYLIPEEVADELLGTSAGPGVRDRVDAPAHPVGR